MCVSLLCISARRAVAWIPACTGMTLRQWIRNHASADTLCAICHMRHAHERGITMSGVSRSELRKFGLTVGGAFIVLGAVSWWRGHDIAPRVLWMLGVLLLVPGAVAPSLLRPIQHGWMKAAGVLGNVNTRIILGAFFYVVLTPVGLVMRLFRDPLNLRFDNNSESTWVRRTAESADPASYERQF